MTCFFFTSIVSLPISSTPSLCQPSAAPPQEKSNPSEPGDPPSPPAQVMQCRWSALESHGPQTQSGCQCFPGIIYVTPTHSSTRPCNCSVLESLHHLPPSESASGLDFHSTNQTEAMTWGSPNSLTSWLHPQDNRLPPLTPFPPFFS